MKRKMDCIPDLPRVNMLCVMFSGVPCGHDSPNPAAGGGEEEFFPLHDKKFSCVLGWVVG